MMYLALRHVRERLLPKCRGDFAIIDVEPAADLAWLGTSALWHVQTVGNFHWSFGALSDRRHKTGAR